MAKTYDITYKGSKLRIAEDLVEALPAGDCFVDLFAGGCAMSHAALLSGKWRRVIANDINREVVELFARLASGHLPDEVPVPSHDEFFETRDSSGLVSALYSFGGDNHSYFCGKVWEDDVTNLLRMVLSNDRDERIRSFEALRTSLSRKQPEELVTHLTHIFYGDPIARWKRLRSIAERAGEVKGQLITSNRDYRDVEIPDGAVVYADPPYANTSGYAKARGFDNDAFWAWVRTRDYPVYVSEISAPEDFVPVWTKIINHGVTASKKSVREALYVYERWSPVPALEQEQLSLMEVGA